MTPETTDLGGTSGLLIGGDSSCSLSEPKRSLRVWGWTASSMGDGTGRSTRFFGDMGHHMDFSIFFCSPNSFEAARMGEVPTSCSSKEPILAGSAGCSGGAGGRLKMILLRIASIYRCPQKVLEKDKMNIVEIHLHLSLGLPECVAQRK